MAEADTVRMPRSIETHARACWLSFSALSPLPVPPAARPKDEHCWALADTRVRVVALNELHYTWTWCEVPTDYDPVHFWGLPCRN